MNGLSKQLAVVLGAAAISFSASLSVLWPSETQADDEETAMIDDDVDAETTKDGRLALKSRLVPDERVKGRWYLEMEIQNNDPIDRRLAELECNVLAFDYRSEMARSMPAPKVVFKCHDMVEVGAGEKVIRRHALPAALAQKIAAKNRTSARQNGNVRTMVSVGPYQSTVALIHKPEKTDARLAAARK